MRRLQISICVKNFWIINIDDEQSEAWKILEKKDEN